MTIADYQLSIGGVALGPGTNYTVHNFDGFGLDMRTNDVPRPRDHGEFYGLDYMPGKTLTITLTVRGTSPMAVVANLDALLAVWQPVAPTVDAISALSYKLPGQVVRQFRGRPRRASADTSRIVGNRIPLTLEYHTADPRQYADVQSSSTVGIIQATSGRTYPRTYPLSFGGGSSVSISAVNAGNFSSRVVATVTGPVVNPTVENVTTGMALTCGIVLGATDSLVIDFDAKTVVLNGTASRYSTIVTGSTWWELAPGTNLIRYSADSYDPASSLLLAWASAWI